VDRLIRRDADALVLVTNDRSIVGSLLIGWDGWRCHLYRLAVHPDYRRRGIGTSLLKRAEERFVAFGGTRADAMVLDGNDSAHELWSWAGYTSKASGPAGSRHSSEQPRLAAPVEDRLPGRRQACRGYGYGYG
jgi:ribosomal protein S18 acetylase RimI-like enzyme